VAAAAAPKALTTGPVVLADADSRDLLSTQLRSGKDLIQTPFGQLPTISDKVKEGDRQCSASQQQQDACQADNRISQSVAAHYQ
jgi:hypothetical protein